MSSVSVSTAVSPTVTQQEMESLERLLASNCISRAPRLQAVLSFIIDAYLEGRANEVNEQVIGQRVFNRPAGYNPSEDNIVRVTVRHLRARLEDYYRTEGQHESFAVDIPKGKYQLTISPRPLETIEPALLSARSSEPPTFPAVTGSTEPHESSLHTGLMSSPWKRSVVACATLAIVAFGAFQFGRTTQNHASASSLESDPSTILQLLSGHGNRVTIVVADANLQAYRSIYKKQIQLQDYIDRGYTRSITKSLDPNMVGAWQVATGTTETNIASSIVAAELKQAASPELADIKHPHDLRMHDFQDENLVLLGGPWINPWGQMFENKFNFRIVPREGDPAGSQLQNENPKNGEPRAFAPHTQDGVTIDYVRVAMLPNLSGKGRLLSIGATNQQALAAGGDFLADATSASKLISLFRVDTSSKLPFFEVVIEVKGIENIPQSRKIVAFRAIDEGA